MSIAGILQKTTRIPMRIILEIFCGFSVKGKKNLKKLTPPFIIAANHTSYIDSYIVGSGFPILKYLKYPATRFMTYQEFIDKPIIGSIIKMYGAYPIERHSKKPIEEVLSETVKILKNGELIMIYPEGKLPKNPTFDGKARPGVAYLAKETGIQILPVAIKKTNRKFLFPKFKVTFGEPFYYKDINDASGDLREDADKIMERSRKLSEEI